MKLIIERLSFIILLADNAQNKKTEYLVLLVNEHKHLPIYKFEKIS